MKLYRAAKVDFARMNFGVGSRAETSRIDDKLVVGSHAVQS